MMHKAEVCLKHFTGILYWSKKLPSFSVSYFCEQTCHTFVQIEHDGLAALDDILRSRLIIHVLAVSCLGVQFSIAPQVLTAQ